MTYDDGLGFLETSKIIFCWSKRLLSFEISALLIYQLMAVAEQDISCEEVIPDSQAFLVSQRPEDGVMVALDKDYFLCFADKIIQQVEGVSPFLP